MPVLVPWCSSCKGLMGGMVRCTGEAHYFRYYKRLGLFAKLATSYICDVANDLKVHWYAFYQLHAQIPSKHRTPAVSRANSRSEGRAKAVGVGSSALLGADWVRRAASGSTRHPPALTAWHEA